MINKWRDKTDENAKSQCAHIRALDRHVYLMNKKMSKDHKSLPHTHIDYFTDFDTTNIYHIWVSHLKQVFHIRNVQINKTVKFDSNNSHLHSLMITEIEDLIHIIEISDLSDIAQADFNYQYEDWDDILISDLKSLSLESTQRHTTATALSDFRKYDQFSTFEAILSTFDSTLKVLICISELTVEFTTKFQITHFFSDANVTVEQSTFTDDQSDHADLSDHLIDMSK